MITRKSAKAALSVVLATALLTVVTGAGLSVFFLSGFTIGKFVMATIQ